MRVSAHTLAIALRAIEESLAVLPPKSSRRTQLILAMTELRFALENLKIQIKEESNGR
jgi:hypothetical protein